MNKYEALMVTGKLEVQFEGQEMLLSEIAKLQNCIKKEDFVAGAISLGRLSELSKNCNAENENLEALAKFFSKCVAETESQQLMNMPIEQLSLSVRAFNCLKRAGINTFGEILEHSEDDLHKVRNLGKTCFEEVISFVESKGFKLKKAED